MASQKRRFFAPEERILWVRFDTKAAGSLGLLCLDARPDAAKRPCEHKKTPLFSQLFLCLSRACLGKIIAFLYKLLEKRRVSRACRAERTAAEGRADFSGLACVVVYDSVGVQIALLNEDSAETLSLL